MSNAVINFDLMRRLMERTDPFIQLPLMEADKKEEEDHKEKPKVVKNMLKK